MTTSRPSSPHKPLTRTEAAHRRTPQLGRHRPCWHRRRRAQAQAAHHRFQARQDRHSGDRGVDRIRSEPLGAHRAASYADGEKRYILQPDGLKVGQKIVERSRCRHSGRQCAAAEKHSARHHRAQHRAEARQGRADGALGGRIGAAGRERRRVRAGEAAFRRDPQSVAWIAWRPSGRSATPITRTSPSARPDARAGWEFAR